jgi:NitT/TauT family transport system permease protein
MGRSVGGHGVSRVPNWAIQSLTIAAVLVLWEWAARAGQIDPFIAPAPSIIWAALAALFVGGEIWPHIVATFGAAMIGLVLGVLIGTVLAALAVMARPVEILLAPLMGALNAVPRIVLAPLLVIWFGIGIASKAALAVLLVAVLMFFAVFSAVAGVDRRLVERVRTLGGGRLLVLREVYLPSIASLMLSSLKVAVGFAFTGAIVGEFVASSRGLGYLLSFAQSTYNTALSLALVALIMAFVMTLLGLAGALERRLTRWR